MKHVMKVVTALIAVAAFSASAIAVECVPLPPKDLEGSIMWVEPVRPSVALTYFEGNGCNWNGNDQLNGSDAYVFDVTEIAAGPATIAAKPLTGIASAYEAVAFDESCARLGDLFTFGNFAGDPEVMVIPVGTKWLGVQGSTAAPANDTTVVNVALLLHSDGKDCDPVEEPKKKKKKKKRSRS